MFAKLVALGMLGSFIVGADVSYLVAGDTPISIEFFVPNGHSVAVFQETSKTRVSVSDTFIAINMVISNNS